MAYRDDIAALGLQHHWPFDGDALDIIGSADGTQTGMAAGPAISEDAAASRATNGTADRIALPTTTTINNSAQSRKIVAGWYSVTEIQPPPKRIYGEGTQNPLFQFMFAYGNNCMFEVVVGGAAFQVFGPVLQPNRLYHLCGVFEGSGFADRVKFYVDGVEQTLAEPNDRQPGVATLGARGVGEFGDPSGGSGVGGVTVTLNSAVNGYSQNWVAGDGLTLTDAEVRETLFEKGALPDLTISSGSEAAMQVALNAVASTVRPDAALCIRIEGLAGGGDLALSLDNVTFDPLASIHVQYTGVDTLTLTNTNGSDASIISTPNGGTVSLVNPAELTITPLIAGSEIRIFEAGTTTEIDGVEASGTSFQATIAADSVDVVIHALGYLHIRERGIDMTGGNVLLPVEQTPDRQYGNS